MADKENNLQQTKPAGNEDLERKKLAIEVELKQKELENFGKAPPAAPKAWWETTVAILGLPAAVLALVVAMTTASGNWATQKKTVAETVQITESMRRADAASKLANDLSAKEKEGPKAFEQAVTQNADKIQIALERLQQLEEESAHINIQRAVLKFVLLWILFSVVGLVFEVLQRAWNTAIGTLAYGANAFFTSAIRQEEEGALPRPHRWKLRWWAAVNRYLPAAAFVLGPMPDILRWSIQLSIFAVLLGPLFNEIALSFGSHITFGDLLREAEHLHFAKVLSMMKQILFTS